MKNQTKLVNTCRDSVVLTEWFFIVFCLSAGGIWTRRKRIRRRICPDWRGTLWQNWTWLCWDVEPWQKLQRGACRANKNMPPDGALSGDCSTSSSQEATSSITIFPIWFSQWSSLTSKCNSEASQTWPVDCFRAAWRRRDCWKWPFHH